jgi:DNA-binding MarR family transcriptional regulator
MSDEVPGEPSCVSTLPPAGKDSLSSIVTANNVPMRTRFNRLSQLQKDILTFLATVPSPSLETLDEHSRIYIAALPTTGRVIEALGRERSAANYAIVSRALARLEQRGLIQGWRSELLVVGKGRRYCLAPRHSD